VLLGSGNLFPVKLLLAIVSNGQICLYSMLLQSRRPSSSIFLYYRVLKGEKVALNLTSFKGGDR
jgi:hypothetical protein